MKAIQIIHYIGYTITLLSIVYLISATTRKKWHRTSAKIEESKVDKYVSEDQHIYVGEYFSSTRTVKSTSYRPILKYTYTVDGKVYTSTKLYSVKILPISTKDLLPIISGSTRDAYFNPRNPSKSYLQQSGLFSPCLFLLIGFVLTFINAEQLNEIWSWFIQFPSETLKL
ncbi:DUF3592 domain-containing protein [Microbulbifer litoralis]|uniref:DUF3592 domain-containing protein n=1 Tax=Microbulbifer litoralis TaxID=2933965 RepID=UPI0020295A93|nr:DUF3592 domain-containing protein [Microbulbifer sp. GX H0434]